MIGQLAVVYTNMSAIFLKLLRERVLYLIERDYIVPFSE